MRITTVITASVSVRTPETRARAAAPRPRATRNDRPMGVTRIAWLAGPDGGGRLDGANMVRPSMPRLRSQFSRSRDRA
jgi:hypothetical protein